MPFSVGPNPGSAPCLLLGLAAISCLACDQSAYLGQLPQQDVSIKSVQDHGPIASDIRATPSPGAIDLLFVIVNTPSMRGFQSMVAKQFPALVESLNAQLRGIPLDLHVGIITTDFDGWGYDIAICSFPPGPGNGILKLRPIDRDCGLKDNWIEFQTGHTNVLDKPKLSPLNQLYETFRCLAEPKNLKDLPSDSSGCTFQEPLEAARRALYTFEVDPEKEINPGQCQHQDRDSKGTTYCSCNPTCAHDYICGGATCRRFHRPEALLAIVFLSNEDDCSPQKSKFYSDAPHLSASNAELGPLSSFRCFEFGVTCDEDRGKDWKSKRQPGARAHCRPIQENPPSYTQHYLHEVEEYVDFFKNKVKSRFPDRVLVFAIAGTPKNSIHIREIAAGKWETEPACQIQHSDGTLMTAKAAYRLEGVVKRMGNHGFLNQQLILGERRDISDGICTENIRPSLEFMGHTIGGILSQEK